MKYLICLLFCACSSNKGIIENITYVESNLVVTGFTFQTTKAPLFTSTVESSIVELNGKVIYTIDYEMNGKFMIGTSNQDLRYINDDARFSYTMMYQDQYYNFINRNGEIYLAKSPDLVNWTMINNSNPVLTKQTGTIYSSIWNVGVAVDDKGVWHLMAETSIRDNDEAGLIYSSATMSNDGLINFDANRSTSHVIEKAGNPWLGYIPGKGLLAVYGSMKSGNWTVRAATKTDKWNENSSFEISAPGMAICDPHLIEHNGQTILTLSYDQKEVYEMRSKETLTELFGRILM